MSANKLTERYYQELPHLETALSAWESKLKDLAKQIDQNVHVTGRCKKIDSLLVKAHKNDHENPRDWELFGDLVALKVIFPTKSGADEFTTLLQAHASANSISCSLDKRRAAPDKLEYSSDQFDLCDSAIVDSRGKGQKVEVQVRTFVSDAWYMIDHRLNYKNPTDLPPNLRRRVLRLIILAELFDEEVSSLMNDVSDFEDSVEAAKFNRVNKFFHEFAHRYAKPARPQGLFEILLTAYDDDERAAIDATLRGRFEIGELGEHYKKISERHKPGADDFLEKYDWLYLQPESLLIADLAQQPLLLKSVIENTDFDRIVTSMADELRMPRKKIA
ncbi:hypothetical protein AQ436_01960 [Arthrobacter sp. EpRS66]|nr:hypothetical protein AQ436_01960 [Arthrobacter sp. EpRS66]